MEQKITGEETKSRARINSLIYSSKKSEDVIKQRIEYLKECINWLEHYLAKRANSAEKDLRKNKIEEIAHI